MNVSNVTTHYGTYGSQFQVDENGDPIQDQRIINKRKSVGRPKKYESSEGSKFEIPFELYQWALKKHFLSPSQ